jgi:ATP-dependent protease ClpP protease subunit
VFLKCDLQQFRPLGGAQGQATEIEIAANHILKTREKLNRILSERTGLGNAKRLPFAPAANKNDPIDAAIPIQIV